MDDDIIIQRSAPTNVLKLDTDEQAMLDEIQVTRKPPKRPFVPQRRPAVVSTPFVQPELNAFTNPNKTQSRMEPPTSFAHEEEEDMMMDDGPEVMEDYGGGGGSPEEQPSEGYTSIEEEKADILNKLSRLEKKGFNVNKRLNAYSSITELRTEIKRIMYGIETEQSIKFSRRMLIACVTGVEFLNKRYNPFDVQLEGWSESVMENVDDYDGVFEELYVKYRTKVAVAPEIKLIMMLGGSAMMFHLTNSMFKTAMPNMNDVLKQNPDLVKNMMNAVKNTQQRQAGVAPEDPTQRPASPVDIRTGRREMKGPGLDISSLMGGIMMPPMMPMNTRVTEVIEEEDNESVSDIVSISGESTGGEVREVKIAKPRKNNKKKMNEVTL
jgi:hypothetical protein